jgi:cytochrome c
MRLAPVGAPDAGQQNRKIHLQGSTMSLSPTLAVAIATATLALSGAAFGASADELITANKCSKCHTATTTKKAPSWPSIAQKYKGDAAAEAKLVNMLKTGGADVHAKVAGSDADLKAVVAVVLSSK